MSQIERPLSIPLGLMLPGSPPSEFAPARMRQMHRQAARLLAKSTIPLHLQIMDNEFFRSGEVDTGFVERVLLQK